MLLCAYFGSFVVKYFFTTKVSKVFMKADKEVLSPESLVQRFRAGLHMKLVVDVVDVLLNKTKKVTKDKPFPEFPGKGFN